MYNKTRGWKAFFYIFFCSPFLVVRLIYKSLFPDPPVEEPEQVNERNKASNRSKEDFLQDSAVPPLPLHRQRSLTISDQGDNPALPAVQHLLTQKQSPLFRLPAELRLIIYRYYFAWEKVHLVSSYRRLACRPCQQPHNMACGCVRSGKNSLVSTVGGCFYCGIFALPLLKLCRRMYVIPRASCKEQPREEKRY